MSKPAESIEVLLEINFDLSLLDATKVFLLNTTLSVYILNFFDLKITFFSKAISFSVRKFPSLAVTVIFCSLLFIENLGSEISDVFLFIVILFLELSVLSIRFDKKRNKIKIIKRKEKIRNILLFNDNNKLNLTTQS